MLLGDFNFDLLKPHPGFTDLCEQFCLTNTITQPTGVTSTSSTLLDLIFTNQENRFAYSGCLHLGLSDHDLIFTIRKNKLPRPTPRFFSYRSMKNFDQQLFLEDLNKFPLDDTVHDDQNSVDEMYLQWSSIFF